jgi:hypothetical protein
MYKLLLFLNKTDDEKIINHFNDYTLKYLSEISGQKVLAASVESSLLLEQKFSKFCEVSVDSKETWDEKMNSKSGRELNKDLMDFHQSVTIIFVDYNR